MEMRDTLEFEMDTSVAEMVAEETAEELDNILKEVINLVEAIEAEKPGGDSIAADGEETAKGVDKMIQTGDTLELEIELPEEITEPQAKITLLSEETESGVDALADAENEVMASLAKEAGANHSGDSSSTVTDKDSEDKDTEKNLAEDLSNHEEIVCDVSEENIVQKKKPQEPPTNKDRSSKHFKVAREQISKAEDAKANACEVSIPDGLHNHAATMRDKRIEETVTLLVEEQLPRIVESIVVEKLHRIFSSIG